MSTHAENSFNLKDSSSWDKINAVQINYGYHFLLLKSKNDLRVCVKVLEVGIK